jgi:hypothetical protein
LRFSQAVVSRSKRRTPASLQKSRTHLNVALDGLLASPVEVVRLSPVPAGTADQGQL